MNYRAANSIKSLNNPFDFCPIAARQLPIKQEALKGLNSNYFIKNK